MQKITRRHALRLGTAAAGILGLPARAQDLMGPSYAPATLLRIVVPHPSRGRTALIARRLVVALHEVMGETVELEFPAEGFITEVTAFSRLPSGSRALILVMVPLPRRRVSVTYQENAVLERLTPIAVVAREPLALAMSAHRARKLEIDTLAQLLHYMRQNPGKLTVATNGDGHNGHLAAELFKSMSQTYMTRIHTPGNEPDLPSVVAGTTDLIFETLHLLRNAIRSSAVRLMGIASSAQQGPIDAASLGLNKPLPYLDTEPSLADYAVHDSHSLFAPPDLAAEDAQLIQKSCAQAVLQNSYRNALQAAMALPPQDSSATFLELEDQEEQRWRRAHARW